MPNPQTPRHRSDTFGRNAALVAAVLGWLFDGFEIGLFPLVGPRALDDLLAAELTANPAVQDAWFGSIMAVFLVGAACGGVLFGWLGDKIGRMRAMSASILTYAIFTGVCGFATDAWQIAAARFVASLGMGGEWALGVALVSELWPDASRPLLAGIIGAAANAGIVGVWMPGGLVARVGSPLAGGAATLVGLGLAILGFLRPVRGYLTRALAAGAISATSSRTTLRNMLLAACLASIASIAWLYLGATAYGGRFLAAATLASLTTAGFYGWYPLVLPELFPTALRTTAQGFAYNFGRVLAAIGSLQTAPLVAFFAPRDEGPPAA